RHPRVLPSFPTRRSSDLFGTPIGGAPQNRPAERDRLTQWTGGGHAQKIRRWWRLWRLWRLGRLPRLRDLPNLQNLHNLPNLLLAKLHPLGTSHPDQIVGLRHLAAQQKQV